VADSLVGSTASTEGSCGRYSARRAPDRRYRQQEQRLHELVPRLRDLVLAPRRNRAPAARAGDELGLVMVLFTIRELVLWDHLAAIVPIPDERLAEQLTRAFLAYLGAPLATPDSRRRSK
jgi:hypothetical protein